MKSLPLRAKAPLRVCLAGEHLDWLGGLSLCCAIDQLVAVDVTAEAATNLLNKPFHEYTDMFESISRLILSDRSSHRPLIARVIQNPLPGMGLASSSAIAVALSYVLREYSGASDSARNALQIAYDYEYAFGNGGGMDHLTAGYGGWMLTDGADGRLPTILEMRGSSMPIRFLIINTRQPKKSHDVLSNLRSARYRETRAFDTYIEEVSQLCRVIWGSMGPLNIKAIQQAMSEAHRLLSTLPGTTSEPIEDLRSRLHRLGLPGTKLSGSGGGGALVAITLESEASQLTAYLMRCIPKLSISIASPYAAGVALYT